MNWLGKVQQRLKAFRRRRRQEAEMTEEMRHHLELQTQENVDAGMSLEEARYAALRQFGHVDGIKETCRDQRGLRWLEEAGQDLRYAVRQLRKTPGFTVVAVLTLALGIGGCAAIFSLVNGVLLQALPYEEPGRLVQLCEDPSGTGRDQNSVAGAQFGDWREQATTLEQLSVVRRVSLNLTGEGRPEKLSVHQVSASYLRILRLQPLLGRGFLPNEDRAGQDRVAVLTHRFWQRYFGGATNLVGRAITLGGESFTVIGILPARPQLPFECDVLVPFVFGSEPWHRARGDHRLRVIGRLKAEATLGQARTELAAITQRLKPVYPTWKQHWGVVVVPMHEQLTGAIRPVLWVLFGAVGFVLLIACANVAGMLLARTAARQREMAIRTALGAGRWRVVRQLMTENLVLALLGGALGLGLGYWGVHVFTRLGADHLPRVQEIGVDGPALAFTALASLLTGLAFGLAPALQLARPNLSLALKQGLQAPRGSLIGRLRGGLIVAEVALALTLLAGAGLLVQTLARLQAVPTGFDPQHVLAMDLSLDDHRHPAGDARAAFLRQIVQRLETLPGVEAAGGATTLPMAGWTDSSVRAESQPAEDRFNVSSDYDFVSGRFHRTMGIPLLRGRLLTERDDTTTAPRTALLNEVLAERLFPGTDPLGQRVRFHEQSWEVVGVVGKVRHQGLDREARAHIYLPQAFSGFPCSLVVRTGGPPLALAETLRQAILELDPDQPVANVRTLEEVVAKAAGQRRLLLVLLGVFAVVALLLAAIGLYGVMAYSVSQRTREVGIRMALGAQPGSVLKLMLKQGSALTLLGIALGLAGACALTRVLASLLFGVSPKDPATFAGVALLLLTVALFACWLPARRAAKVDPVVALRAE